MIDKNRWVQLGLMANSYDAFCATCEATDVCIYIEVSPFDTGNWLTTSPQMPVIHRCLGVYRNEAAALAAGEALLAEAMA